QQHVLQNIPRNLKELGYQINEKGQFLTLEGEIYNFDVKERSYNEALYDVIIELLMEWVEERLQNDFGLQKILLPINATKDDIHSKIYVSPDYLENDKMMIFIPGTANMIGCWSRRVMIDVSINDGSMISYVKRAREMGFSVIIVNPNEVFWYKGKAVVRSETPESHTNYVFENFVIPSSANKIFIVANSYGGHCAVDVMQNFFELLKNRVKGIEFTETTHSIDFVKTILVRYWIIKNCRNWLMSSEPAGSEIRDSRFGCISFSSGAENNEFVTYEVIDRVFEHVAKKLEQLENGATESNDENEEDIEDEYLNEPSFFQNTIIDDVQDKLAEALKPIDLEIINESDLHAHHQAMKDVSSNETHFRHRWIYQLLGEELKRGVHALSIKAKTPKEINKEN
ncbi:8803_t:CDS:10, partial [Entrophospora sp. SA101]